MDGEHAVIHLPGGDWSPRPTGLWEPPTAVPEVADMVATMDREVAGLDMPKKRLALALQTHLLCGLRGIDDRQPNLIIVGPTGCLAGDQEVLTPDGPVPVGEMLGWNLVLGPAGPALSYGYHGGQEELFCVAHEQGEFIATGQHRSLVSDGERLLWQRVSEMRPGAFLHGFSDDHPQTSWDNDPSTRDEGGRRFWETALGSLASCSGGCRHGDEQLRWVVTSGLASVPSPDDALARIRNGLPGDLVHGLGHIPSCQSFSLLSRPGSSPLESHALETSGCHAGRGDASRSADYTPVPRRSHGRRNLPWLALESGRRPVASLLAPDRTSRVLSVTPLGNDEFYDLLIPGAPFYRTKGGWTHHNGGKSVLTQTACEVAGLPYIDVNATEYSETGFVGKDISQMLLRFNDPRWRGEGTAADVTPLAERYGVAIIDEFDKLAFKANLRERQVEKKLQYEMLRFAEGVVTTVRENDEEVGYPFDTRNILFIAVGAFQSLGSLPVDDPQHVEARHIVQYGFIEELVGRFSSVVGLPHLRQDALVRVLSERFLPWYEQVLEAQGIHLDFTQAGMQAMADVVIHEQIGARGLQGLLEKVLTKARIIARPGQTIHVAYEHVPGGAVVVD